MTSQLLISIALLAIPALGEDTILARAEVPNGIMPQAEIRLIERGNEMVVQSLIQTRFPGKVRSKIVKNEQANWTGHADASTYITALEAAFARYENRSILAIDFISGPGGTRVDFSFPPAPVWRSLPLSAAYVQRNQEYILADAFGKETEDVVQMLRKLNPLEIPNGN